MVTDYLNKINNVLVTYNNKFGYLCLYGFFLKKKKEKRKKRNRSLGKMGKKTQMKKIFKK